MFFSSTVLSSNASSSSRSSATIKVFDAVQSQSLEEKVPLTSKGEVEKKLASTLIQVQQNQITRLNLTSASLGRFYELAHTWSGHENAVCSLAVLKNGALASGSGNLDKSIKLWDLTSHSCVSTLHGHTAIVWALAVLPNGALASGSRDSTIKFWDLTSHSCLSTLQGHTNAVCALAVTPNGQLASGSADQTIKLWDLTSHSCLFTLRGHRDIVFSLTVLPNGHLASGSSDSTIKFWDLALHSCVSTLYEAASWVRTLAALPNGLLASGSYDTTIKLWDPASHSCLSTLQGHTKWVLALAVLPNGRLASGSLDNTIKIWEPRTLSTKQLPSILNALKNNTSVTDLDLSGNQGILDDLISPLLSIFTPDTSSGSKTNASVKTIDLRRTGVSKKGIKRLEKSIEHQRLSIEVLADCPIEWMMIYFLIVFCRANRNSPFADSGLDLCKHGEIGPFLGITSGFFTRFRENFSSSKRIALPPNSPS